MNGGVRMAINRKLWDVVAEALKRWPRINEHEVHGGSSPRTPPISLCSPCQNKAENKCEPALRIAIKRIAACDCWNFRGCMGCPVDCCLEALLMLLLMKYCMLTFEYHCNVPVIKVIIVLNPGPNVWMINTGL